MLYYLVALFDKDSYALIKPMQESISNEYKLYKNLPMLHITLAVIEDPDMDKLNDVIKNTLKSYKKFKVCLNGVICFGSPYKSVNLKVDESIGKIKEISRLLYKNLTKEGFTLTSNPDTWHLHVSLANPYFAQRVWGEDEFESACIKLENYGFNKDLLIDEIQFWRPINDESKMVVFKYPLP
ncbi:2'-5' RNA ligase family protein [Clostridium perfringens]|nr:2'-5' RNA ligase family protein [Clostridium perfringens]